MKILVFIASLFCSGLSFCFGQTNIDYPKHPTYFIDLLDELSRNCPIDNSALIKDEFETTEQFNRRVIDANRKWQEDIKAIVANHGIVIIKNVPIELESYNADIQVYQLKVGYNPKGDRIIPNYINTKSKPYNGAFFFSKSTGVDISPSLSNKDIGYGNIIDADKWKIQYPCEPAKARELKNSGEKLLFDFKYRLNARYMGDHYVCAYRFEIMAFKIKRENGMILFER